MASYRCAPLKVKTRMNFKVEDKGNYSLITSMVEKLDTSVAPELKSEVVMLDKSGKHTLVIDLSETRYCDSSGLSALLVANRLTKAGNGSLAICGLQPSVEKLIQISQLHTVLNIAPSVDGAVELISVS